AVIEHALAAANAAEIEAQRRESALLEHVEEIVDDLVVHRAAELRMQMQDERDRRALILRRLIAAFETAGGAGKNDFGHVYSRSDRIAGASVPCGSALDAAGMPP